MIGYVLRRVGQALVILLLVTIIIFLLLHSLPGGTARAVLGPRATNTAIAQFNKLNGFDQPLPLQYWSWLSRALRGNLGFSYSLNQSVAQLLAERVPRTMLLAATALVVALVVSIPLGFYQALRRNRILDYVLTALTFVFYSTPAFWLALILIDVFAIRFPIFPAQAPQGTFPQVLAQPQGIVLPVAVIALVSIAYFARYMRSSALENLTQDYVRTARAKGASIRRVAFRHVLRNALTPVVTLVGLSLPFVFTGTLISEEIFNYPGAGLLFFNAAVMRDYPVLLGVILIVATATVVGNLIADICYALLDPRVRLSSD